MVDRLKNIVVGLDASEGAAVTLDQAARLARQTDARLHVMHVVQALNLEDFPDMYTDPLDQAFELTREHAETHLKEMIEAAGLALDQVDLRVPIGQPFLDLLRLVREVSADLLVLGARGEAGHGVGAVASKCVRKAPVPVLLVRPPHAGPFQRIVACVDFSETSGHALDRAAALAARDGARLDVVHTFATPWNVAMYPMGVPEVAPEIHEECFKSLEAQLARFVQERLGSAAPDATHTHLLESFSPARGIIEFVRENDGDLVVLGTRGRTGVRALLMGTTAERIIRRCPCCVLAIKPQGFSYEIE